MNTPRKIFTSSEDIAKWFADMALNRPNPPNFEESFPRAVGADHPIDPKHPPSPKPAFKPGAVMTDTGIYVDENGTLWHVDPYEGNVDLLIPDDDV